MKKVVIKIRYFYELLISHWTTFTNAKEHKLCQRPGIVVNASSIMEMIKSLKVSEKLWHSLSSLATAQKIQIIHETTG